MNTTDSSVINFYFLNSVVPTFQSFTVKYSFVEVPTFIFYGKIRFL
ncbi:hypothetical protein LEP1GSC096_3332 [Leptospira interrogans serovar Hebdomadis str. R499]|nr:hypothetical protein LEP1GSC045_1764 [Leptospira interrogans serovar Pomona str. Kennewicki LC82-25]EKN99304.1 hypothetical protein LEP1GSC014_0498 [Leptospira interrogans serovar Pomona str. Pomona]EKR35514.1 hypothetical protein LEP1GSC096_3332 [Leptospira interrogans serovar Hebdomadis str. R499]EMF35177.1 hypothetical protein LEP1GSC201_1227 [Leptospira interrogans serovar Pomona str. Fox 32256]EMJ58763.1 hypothetical protein LEP1GSC197_2587 [Leptospira interrogans serovar Pomona str. CS